jgi:hypothetical protein
MYTQQVVHFLYGDDSKKFTRFLVSKSPLSHLPLQLIIFYLAHTVCNLSKVFLAPSNDSTHNAVSTPMNEQCF